MLPIAQLFDYSAFFAAALIFIPLERLLAARPQKLLRPQWSNDLLYVFVNGLVIRIVLLLMVALVLAASRALVPGAIVAAVSSQPLWLQLAELILLADLAFYAVHRLFHSVPALWRIHQVHHSIEEMDWLAAARVHPVDQILTKGASLIPCFALGFSPWAIAAWAGIYHWHSLLLHANVRLGWGRLGKVIASPNFHHWHHCRDREAWDRNFAGQLALWDWLFGTFHLPGNRTAESFGIAEAVPASYAAQLLHPFRRRGSEAVPENG